MEEPILKNQDQYPTEEVIAFCLGGRNKLWDLFFETIRVEDDGWNFERIKVQLDLP